MGRQIKRHQTISITYADSLASVTGEAVRVIRVSQCSDHSTLHVVSTQLALCTKENVVVLAAIVVIVLQEVATRGQLITTHWGGGDEDTW